MPSAKWRPSCLGLNVLIIQSTSHEKYSCSVVVHQIMWLTIDLIHKSQNALAPNSTMHHSEQKCAHFRLNGALWDMEQEHGGICKTVYYPYF